MADERILPTDEYSALRGRLLDNPDAVKGHGSTLDLTDFYRNAETWVAEVIVVDGDETWFLQRIRSTGGERWVIPAKVVHACRRQSATIAINRAKAAARRAAATRKAKGIVPFQKNPAGQAAIAERKGARRRRKWHKP